MGGARIHEIVEAVRNVDLIEAHLRSCLALPPTIKPSRRPRTAVVNTIVHAPATGRLTALPFADRDPDCIDLAIDLEAEVGDHVDGPDQVFASVLAEVTLVAKNLRRARALTADLLRNPPQVVPGPPLET
jgi:hypothetical protein